MVVATHGRDKARCSGWSGRLGLSDQRQASGKTESSRRGDTEREQDRRWRMRQPIKQERRRFEIEVPEIVVSRVFKGFLSDYGVVHGCLRE